MEKELHKESRTIETLLARIKGETIDRANHGSKPLFHEPVPEPNRNKLLAFYRQLQTEELSNGRVAVLLGDMYRVSCWLNHRPFEELTKDDIIDLINRIKSVSTKMRAKRIEDAGYKEQTIENYKQAIKKFWKWLKGTEDYPPEVSWIKRKKDKNSLLPEDCWTPEEVRMLAEATTNLRDRAFVFGLFGCGCRIGEFIILRRKDINFDEYTCYLLVKGKTGHRRVRVTPAGTTALATWLDLYSNKDPEAYVWVNIQMKTLPTQHLGYDWAHKLLNDLKKKTGIIKPIRPHLLRHSLATWYAPKLTEAVMNEHFGWQQGGRTASIYTHLSGKQVDDQILAAFGKKKLENDSKEILDAGFPITKQLVKEVTMEREQSMIKIIGQLRQEVELLKVGSRINTPISYETTESGDWIKLGTGSAFIQKRLEEKHL